MYAKIPMTIEGTPFSTSATKRISHGNRPEVAISLFAPGYTMASVIANEFTEATSDLYLGALIEIGLLLFAVTVIVNALARLLVWSVGGAVKQVRE